MKRHPKMHSIVLALIKGKWRMAYHLGTQKADGTMNYYARNANTATNHKAYIGGCHWLLPAQVKPLPKRKYGKEK